MESKQNKETDVPTKKDRKDQKKNRGPGKFDIRHKETLTLFLREYFELFFPELVPKIQFETVKFLDKELIALFQEEGVIEGAENQDRLTDALVLVEAVSGNEPELFLIHWEQQGEKQENFEERMFHYFCGIYYKFRIPVFPIAMFTDPKKWRKPIKDKFTIKLFKHQINEYSYSLIKLKNFAAEEFEKKASENPLASAYLPLTSYPRKQRPAIKAKAIKGIADLPEGKKKSTLYSLIDISIKLNEEEEKQFNDFIRTDPDYKEVKMLETIEEVGLEKGLEKGLLIGQILLMQELINRITYSYEELKKKKFNELEEILMSIKPNLKHFA